MKQQFKVVKNFVASEAEALAQVCSKNGLKPKQLTAMHTGRVYIWEKKDEAYRVDRAETTEDEARRFAMNHFETFAGNLRKAHTEKEFVFEKIR